MWEFVWVCLCICICGEVWVIAVRGYLRRHAEIQNGRVASGIRPDVPCRAQYIAWGSLRCTLVPSSSEWGRRLWFCWKRRTIWVIWGHGGGDWPTDHHWTTQDPQYSMLCFILNAMLCVNWIFWDIFSPTTTCFKAEPDMNGIVLIRMNDDDRNEWPSKLHFPSSFPTRWQLARGWEHWSDSTKRSRWGKIAEPLLSCSAAAVLLEFLVLWCPGTASV